MQTVKSFKFIVRNQFDGVQSNRTGERLGQRAFGGVKELQIFRKRTPTVTLRNVRRN